MIFENIHPEVFGSTRRPFKHAILSRAARLPPRTRESQHARTQRVSTHNSVRHCAPYCNMCVCVRVCAWSTSDWPSLTSTPQSWPGVTPRRNLSLHGDEYGPSLAEKSLPTSYPRERPVMALVGGRRTEERGTKYTLRSCPSN